MSHNSTRCRLLIVDPRSATGPPLSTLLERAARSHEVRLVTKIEVALATIAALAPAAVLIHVDFHSAHGNLSPSPLLARLCQVIRPHVPLLLYADAAAGAADLQAATGLVRAPLVLARRLEECFEEIILCLLEVPPAAAACAREEADAALEGDHALPRGFMLDQWLGQAEAAIIRASLREHKSATQAASALGMEFLTFSRRLGRHGILLAFAGDPNCHEAPSVLWCSSSPPPVWMTEACDASGVRTKPSLPGTLHHHTLLSPGVLAAVVEPIEAGSAVDAWVLRRSVRPYLFSRSPSAPLRFLLEELRAFGPTGSSRDAVRQLLHAARATACLYADLLADPLLSSLFHGAPTWPLEVTVLLRKLEVHLLLLAGRSTATHADAARAVGLQVGTYRARLRRALRDL